jgi:hypothetical protein
MALSRLARKPAWHFWARLAGLTGLLVLAAGLVVFAVTEDAVGLAVAGVGGLFAALALLAELKGAAGLVLSRRGAVGSNVFVQVLLAAGLLVGVNVFSFFHYTRFDWTRYGEFTIPADVRTQLARLREEAPTRIVVYQRQASTGQLAEGAGGADNYDAAADRKIVEKVKDLAEQFQELGPRFRVELLDRRDQDFQDRLAALRQEAPTLAEAIDGAAENSIFFYGDGRVQRLAFHDVYQLDKRASQEANGGRGNLMLRFQGVGPFARRVLNLDERRPRVAVGVVHEVLGLENPEEIGMAGARKALAARGFETRDLILKRWQRGSLPEPAVLTRDEFKYERLEATLASLDQSLKQLDEELAVYGKQAREWASRPAADLAKKYVIVRGPEAIPKATVDALRRQGRLVQSEPVSEEVRRAYLEHLEKEWLPELRERRQQAEKRQTEAAGEKGKLNVEGLEETRRLRDLRAKLSRTLADCDLLILPRMTLFNVARGERIQGWLHHLDNAQVDVVKDFLKAGKPVLFCLGPPNEPPDRPPPPGVERFDRLEKLVGDLGFKVPDQTILFNVEAESLAEQQAGLIILGPPPDVPPLRFALPTDPGKLRSLGGGDASPRSNPIRTSLGLAARSVGKKGSLDLRLRNPRPVYFDPHGDEKPDLGAAFLFTSADCWNESQPFVTDEGDTVRVPKFERAKPDDPTRGTLKEERRGPFPVAAAVEERLPASWYAEKGGAPAKVRVAVIGHGGVFMGPTITPAKERMLLDVCNWLLGRDDLLARDTPAWEYPRVELSDGENALWQWATRLGMPLLFVYFGLVVLMVRRMR